MYNMKYAQMHVCGHAEPLTCICALFKLDISFYSPFCNNNSAHFRTQALAVIPFLRLSEAATYYVYETHMFIYTFTYS